MAGKLIPIGGGEDKKGRKRVLERFMDVTGRRDPVIGVVTTATSLPEETSNDYRDAFGDLGVHDIIDFNIDNREDANRDKYIDQLKDVDGIIFSGGDQLKLSSILGGTKFLETIKDLYEHDDLVIAGTSAGAAMMPTTMIVRGSSRDALIRGELELTAGIGLIQDVVIDTHFTQRGRFGRLIQAVVQNPSMLGIGLSEDTGAIIYDNNEIEIIGSGLVILVDGLNIKKSNIAICKEGDPLSIENIILHVLDKGDRFFIKEREFVMYSEKNN